MITGTIKLIVPPESVFEIPMIVPEQFGAKSEGAAKCPDVKAPFINIPILISNCSYLFKNSGYDWDIIKEVLCKSPLS